MVKAIHTAVRGRARYKIDGLFRSGQLRRFLESRLAQHRDIINYSVSDLTGNALVIYNSGNTPQSIAAVLEVIVSEYRKGGNGGGPSRAVRQTTTETEVSQKPEPGRHLRSRRKLRKLIIDAEDQSVQSWHVLEASSVVRAFDVDSARGLTDEQANANLKRYGPNLLPESVPRSGLSIFLGQFKSLPVALLGVAAAVSILTGGIADALVIAGVVATNAVIGYVTESQSEKTIHSLKTLVRPSASVVRDRTVQEVRAEDIVPGDLLVLKPGSYIAADARLIEARHLSVDESALTGESMPVTKETGSLPRNDIALADRTNMVYMGTLATGGQGIAVVVATGKYTEIGMIQALVGEARPPETPMERQLDRMSNQLVIISGGVCLLVMLIGLLRGYGFLEMLKSSISLAVAAVPEGLPAVATTTLALGIRNMRRHHVLIRHLEAVETLGSVQTICMDKTGTLTYNRMTVREVHSGSRRISVAGGKYHDGAEFLNPYRCDELLRLIHVGVLCNESDVAGQEGKYVVTGSPTENALIHLAIDSGVSVLNVKQKFPLIRIVHRSETRNFMVSYHDTAIGRGRVVAVKGSPQEVLALCSWQLRNGEKIPLTDENRLTIELANEHMAAETLRVLGAAYAYTDEAFPVTDDEDISDGLTWLGMVGMTDPIRDGVKDLIGQFHSAGIATVMITGDQTPTAQAIGKELDLSKGEQLEILDSRNLSQLPPEVLTALCERVHVFSRVSPAHKLEIVQSLQKAGRTVAMTGDGINDGPALKAADIGVAMGHTGTDVAREVADVVLENDNLETLVIAVSQGRTIYNNIRKSLHFLLSTNLSEIMVMFLSIAGGLGHPLSPMQLLWINLVSDIAPGLALALEPPEPDVLSMPPRDPREPIVKPSDFRRITFESAVLSAGTMAAYGYGVARYGRGPRAGSMAFMSLTIGQILHALSCRSERHSIFDSTGPGGMQPLPPNRFLTASVAGSLVLQALALIVPGLRGLLGIAPISVIDGAVIGGAAVMPLLINEATKKAGEKAA